MQLIDDDRLRAMGLEHLSGTQRVRFIERFTEVLEFRIGHRLADGMSNREVDEFGEIIDSGDDEIATSRLMDLAPDHREVVHEELNFVINEVKVAVELARESKNV